MSATQLDELLPALSRESVLLVDYSLDVFLNIDFLDHSILGGLLTGGQVVTYLAREADRMADELLAATGQLVPAPDLVRRWDLSEGGHERPGAVMVDDIQEATERLQEVVASVTDWSILPADIQALPARRLLQVVVHLVDLGRPWDRLDDASAEAAAAVISDVLGQELSGYHLNITDANDGLRWSNAGGVVEVSGPPRTLLGWATGRTEHTELPVDFPTPALRVWI